MFSDKMFVSSSVLQVCLILVDSILSFILYGVQNRMSKKELKNRIFNVLRPFSYGALYIYIFNVQFFPSANWNFKMSFKDVSNLSLTTTNICTLNDLSWESLFSPVLWNYYYLCFMWDNFCIGYPPFLNHNRSNLSLTRSLISSKYKIWEIIPLGLWFYWTVQIPTKLLYHSLNMSSELEGNALSLKENYQRIVICLMRQEVFTHHRKIIQNKQYCLNDIHTYDIHLQRKLNKRELLPKRLIYTLYITYIYICVCVFIHKHQ